MSTPDNNVSWPDITRITGMDDRCEVTGCRYLIQFDRCGVLRGYILEQSKSRYIRIDLQ
jgi:hypothetical protein